jgi:hypothetical protein
VVLSADQRLPYPRTSYASRTGAGSNLTLVPFYELRIDGVLRNSGTFVLWGTYLFVGQAYAAFVAWHCSLHATHT